MQVNWSDIEKKYPDKWAFITNIHREGGSIIDCTLIRIVSFQDVAKTAYELRDKKVQFEYVRTTESPISIFGFDI